jgi:hypothetical protein
MHPSSSASITGSFDAAAPSDSIPPPFSTIKKPTVQGLQLGKKWCYGTHRFNTAFTKAHHCTIPSARSI